MTEGGRLSRASPRLLIVPSFVVVTLFLLFFFWVDAQLVAVEVRFVLHVPVLLFPLCHLWDFFFLKPPKRTFFFGCTRWIVRIANFAKPCVRRIERRSARGLQTFIRRRHLPDGRMCLQ